MDDYIQNLGVHPYRIQPPSAFIATPSAKLLINAGENIQRLATEHKLRIAKIHDILITSLSPSSIGGLPGLLLTLGNLETSSLTPKRVQKLAQQFHWPKPNKKYSFGSSFAGTNWYRLDQPHPSTASVHFRPILLRNSHQQNDHDDNHFDHQLPQESWHPKSIWDENQLLTHTIRRIRIWGPPGVFTFLQKFVNLCGRLSKLNIEIYTITATPTHSLPDNQLAAQESFSHTHGKIIDGKTDPSTHQSATSPPTHHGIHTDQIHTDQIHIDQIHSVKYCPGLYSTLDLDLTFHVISMPTHKHAHTPKTTEEPQVKRRRCDNSQTSHSDLVPLISGRGKRKLGRFLVNKARELSIPVGPLYGKLKNGDSVELEDGRVISPEMVCEASEEGRSFLILNICSREVCERVIDLVLRSGGGGVGKDVDLMYHMSPLEVVKSASYEKLRHFFGWKKEIYSQSCVDLPPVSPYVAVEALNSCLSGLLPSFYRKSEGGESGFLDKIVLSGGGIVVEKGPDLAGDVSERVSELAENISGKTKELAACRDAKLSSVLSALGGERWSGGGGGDRWSWCTLLGTGSSNPSKYRNVSSTLLEFGNLSE